MRFVEAFDDAMFSLNAGGVPVVLSRFSSGLKDAVRVLEVRARWTVHQFPCGSRRGPMIVDTRHRTAEGWSVWASDETPFSVGDMTWPYWEVRHPDHVGRSGYPCPACMQEELRTDLEMIKVYGPVTAVHRCGSQAFAE
jgi:hypothetical protein